MRALGAYYEHTNARVHAFRLTVCSFGIGSNALFTHANANTASKNVVAVRLYGLKIHMCKRDGICISKVNCGLREPRCLCLYVHPRILYGRVHVSAMGRALPGDFN